MEQQQIPEIVYVTFAGGIDNGTTKRFNDSFNLAVNNGVKHVHLLIQSAGGIVGDGIAIYNYLRNLPIEITCYNGGSVSSIAVVLFLAGKTRKASSTATFMIHRSTYAFPNSAGVELMKSRIFSGEIEDENSKSILKEHIKLTQDQWGIYTRGDLMISSAEAKKCGLIDEISDFKPPEGSKIYNI